MYVKEKKVRTVNMNFLSGIAAPPTLYDLQGLTGRGMVGRDTTHHKHNFIPKKLCN